MKLGAPVALLWALTPFSVAAQVAPSAPPPNIPAERGPLEPGANSFTEAQARQRLERMGYSEISGLRKDDSGIWRGRAVYGGRQVEVGVDYRGGISRQ